MSMFGAINRFISRLDADPKAQETQTKGAYGFQVLKNTNAETSIEPWYDFVIGINGHNIDNADPHLFATEVRNCAGSSVELGLWSAKGARVRSLWIEVPKSSSLGLALQWMPLATTEDVWHILDVAPNSPADLAGLLPYGDYIIGSPEGLLKGEAGLGELVEDYIQQSLQLYVYNQEYNVTRLVTIEPSKTWGGQGALGCTLGYGALHRIPAPLEEPPQGPGETLFETTRFSSDVPGRPSSTLSSQGPPRSDAGTPQYLTPADMNLGAGGPLGDNTGSPKAPPVLGRGGRKKHGGRAAAAVAVDMDAYFQEGEEKSRELDYASSPKPNAAVAPPPKGPLPKVGELVSESNAESEKDTAQDSEEAAG